MRHVQAVVSSTSTSRWTSPFGFLTIYTRRPSGCLRFGHHLLSYSRASASSNAKHRSEHTGRNRENADNESGLEHLREPSTGKKQREIVQGYSKMRSYVQFITTPTADTRGTALLLHFDDKKYVIGNIHEGLQRAGLQVGSRFYKAKDIFITGKTDWNTNGGLLGLILTSADAATASASSRAEEFKAKAERAREAEQRRRKRRPITTSRRAETQYVEDDPTVTLHGGPNLTHTIATARSFIFRKGTPIKVNENGELGGKGVEARNFEPSWADKHIQVWAMPLSPSTADDTSTDSRPVSPRKRSLGEYMSGQRPSPAEIVESWAALSSLPEDQEAQAQAQAQTLRKSIVSEMFCSNWQFDNLVETPLHKVKLPATLFVRDAETNKLKQYEGPLPDETTPVPTVNVLVRQPWPGASVDYLPPTKPSTTAVSYIIRNHKLRGKFKASTADALKVPGGPLRAKLATGSPVLLEDGRTITPEMVLEPGKEGSGIAVIDLPSKDYVYDLVNKPEWGSERVMAGIGAVVWILGVGVIEDKTLRKFIEKHPGLKHIISSFDRCPNYLSMTSAATKAVQHNQIAPKYFSIPVHLNATMPKDGQQPQAPDKEQEGVLTAKRGLRIDLEPNFGLNETEVVPLLDTSLLVQETPQKVLELGEAARREIQPELMQAANANQGIPGSDAEIVCLGTGSALPSPYRNVSATLLRVPGSGSYLLDCGENTLGQLQRMYTLGQLAQVLRDLKMIWISHLHADHHLGITSVIKAWYDEVHGRDAVKRPKPSLTDQLLNPAKYLNEERHLFVVGHGNMMRWLEEYSSVEDFGYDQLIPLESIPAKSDPELSTLGWNGIDVGFNTSTSSAM